MGGYHSKQKVTDTTDVVSNAVLDVVQTCTTYMAGDQEINITGDGNDVSDNVQSATMTINAACVDKIGQYGTFNAHMSDSVTQQLASKGVAMTGWLDPGGSTQSTSIKQNVTDNVSFSDAQASTKKLATKQLIVVSGSGDVVVNNLQTQSTNLMADSLMSGPGQVATCVNSITDTVNQHATQVESNPLACITDAMDTLFHSALGIAALVFIAVIILAVVFEFGHSRGGGGRLDGAYIPPPAMPPPTMVPYE